FAAFLVVLGQRRHLGPQCVVSRFEGRAVLLERLLGLTFAAELQNTFAGRVVLGAELGTGLEEGPVFRQLDRIFVSLVGGGVLVTAGLHIAIDFGDRRGVAGQDVLQG